MRRRELEKGRISLLTTPSTRAGMLLGELSLTSQSECQESAGPTAMGIWVPEDNGVLTNR